MQSMGTRGIHTDRVVRSMHPALARHVRTNRSSNSGPPRTDSSRTAVPRRNSVAALCTARNTSYRQRTHSLGSRVYATTHLAVYVVSHVLAHALQNINQSRLVTIDTSDSSSDSSCKLFVRKQMFLEIGHDLDESSSFTSFLTKTKGIVLELTLDTHCYEGRCSDG